MSRRNTKGEVLEVLGCLLDAAMRCELHHGRSSDEKDGFPFGGEPLDDERWWELRQACLKAKYCLNRNGARRLSYYAGRDLPEREDES